MGRASKAARGLLTALFLGTACAAPSHAISVTDFHEKLSQSAQAYALRFALNTEAARKGSQVAGCLQNEMITDSLGIIKEGYSNLVQRINRDPGRKVEEVAWEVIGEICDDASNSAAAGVRGTSAWVFAQQLFPQRSEGSKALRLAAEMQKVRLDLAQKPVQAQCVADTLINPVKGADGKPSLPPAFLEIVNGIYSAQPAGSFIEEQILGKVAPCFVPLVS